MISLALNIQTLISTYILFFRINILILFILILVTFNQFLFKIKWFTILKINTQLLKINTQLLVNVKQIILRQNIKENYLLGIFKKTSNIQIFIYLISQYWLLFTLDLKNNKTILKNFILDYRELEFEDFFYKYWENLNFLLFLNNVENFNIYSYKYHHAYYLYWRDYNLSYNDYFLFINIFRENFKDISFINLEVFLHYTNTPYKIQFSKSLFSYLLPIYTLFKTILVSTTITFLFFILLITYYYINIFKQLATWLIIGFLFFWLLSGFNFFLKNSFFGKFTSALSRFWKRTNVYFWLVEGFLFVLFFYYYLNSSQEPLYSYDYIGISQSYLPNLYNTYINNLILVFMIVYFYVWVLSLAGFTNQQNLFHCFILTLIILYIYINESYQFYYILTIFFENLWVYNHETNLWVLEFETPRLRVKNQYLILALIAKYWHFIFIFLSWIFFIIKLFEQKRAQYTHTGFNLQNLIILFWLNFLFIISWIKWISRRFFDSVYYWFFTDVNFHYIKFFFQEFII